MKEIYGVLHTYPEDWREEPLFCVRKSVELAALEVSQHDPESKVAVCVAKVVPVEVA